MSTLREQVELESMMIDSGIHKLEYLNNCADARGIVASTGYSSKIIQTYTHDVSEVLAATLAMDNRVGIKRNVYAQLRKLPALTATYLAIQTTINGMADTPSVQNLAINIGKRIEYEVKFTEFSKKYPELMMSLNEYFDSNNTISVSHKIKVLTANYNSRNEQWASWSTSNKLDIGTLLLGMIINHTDIVSVIPATKTRPALIAPSEAFTEFAKKYIHHLGVLNPDRGPCIVPPCDWESLYCGGFYSPKMRGTVPLVKCRNKEQAKMLDGDLGGIFKAVNGLQKTAWKVNTDVLDVMLQAWESGTSLGGLPRSQPYLEPVCSLDPDLKKKDMTPEQLDTLYDFKRECVCVRRLEQERTSKCYSIAKALKLANKFRDQPIWFVYQCDFRGRMYAFTDGLSPQGSDPSKALLMFHDGKPLGTNGLRWLRIHGANCYGVDKVSFDDRIAWVINAEQHIKRVAEDPMSYVSFWEQADKPWQFLAFCFEYNRYLSQGVTMVSHLPVGVDGSCNGLQNYSALLRDPVGGKATNLIPSDKPQDIYAEVSKVCTQYLKTMPSEWARMLVQYAEAHGGYLPRGAAKRPVMTLPYGSTMQSCREYVYQWIVDETGEYFPKNLRWKLAGDLSKAMWKSMSRVVVAARTGMDWLQQVAQLTAKAGKPFVWWSPVGFPVYQARFKVKTKRVYTILTKPVHIVIKTETSKIDSRKQRTSSAPNFIHSLDAAHAMLTISAMLDQGITSFAFIHDDFGTHACDVDALSRTLREQFVQMYTENDPLMELKNTCECALGVHVPDPPEKMGLDLSQVLESKYFFA